MFQHKTIQSLQSKKKRGDKITMLTAYDYPTGKILDQTGIDIVLVGDSLANVVLGLASTREVGMDEMIHHAKAVRRGVEQALLVGDMPFTGYQLRPEDAVVNAKRFIKEAGCHGVKVEWFEHCLEVTENILAAGIPVMGHVGLTPQTAEQLGGFKVQGKDADTARQILEHAIALEKKGCFSIVLECIPAKLAQLITKKLSIPTIGIGAGVHCDGQVLVTNDLLGLFDRYKPKFVKQYANLMTLAKEGVTQFKEEVEKGRFPDADHSFSMNPQEFERLKVKR
jgi:3-methyl-2-oxobutanoate hydroxymethyltransferase